MRKIVFAFIVGCSSFFMESTPGMSGNLFDDQGVSGSVSSSKYRRLEGEYNDLMKYQEQSEMSYIQVKEELETTRKKFKNLEDNYKNLEEKYKNLEEYNKLVMKEYGNISEKNKELEKENRELKAAQKKPETEISTMKQKSAAINENNNHMLRNLNVISLGQVRLTEENGVESKVIESENTSRFWEENLRIEEESLIDMDDGYSITDSGLLGLYEYESQIGRTNSREISEIFIENNNLKFEMDEAGEKISPNENESSNIFQQSVDQMKKRLSIKFEPENEENAENSQIDTERFLFSRETQDASVAEKLMNFEEEKNSHSDPGSSTLRREMTLSEDTRNSRANSDSSPEKVKERPDIESKEGKIFVSGIPNSTFHAREYFTESPLNSFTRSDFGFCDTEFSFDNSEEKLEKALRKIQELKNALQKALDDKLEAENNNLRLKGVNDNLVRQLSEKNQEIKKFRSDFSEICRDIAEIFDRIDSDTENDQAKNFSKLYLIKDKLSRINSIVHDDNGMPTKRKRYKTSTLKNQVGERKNKKTDNKRLLFSR
ncbi:MAG: hypothetical protein J5821_00645 [Alphaproteobacteria bacterium]|nr:hypothetical protein [Alphaproteobacteria bacterium]